MTHCFSDKNEMIDNESKMEINKGKVKLRPVNVTVFIGLNRKQQT